MANQKLYHGLDMQSNGITGLPAPSASTDVSNRSYVDDKTKMLLTEDVVIAGNTVYADAVKPVGDPASRDGWHFKNDRTNGTSHIAVEESKNKINWYFYDGLTYSTTWADFKYGYAVLTMDTGADKHPWFFVVTSLSPWVSHSFHVKAAGVTLTLGKTYLVWFGNEAPPSEVHPTLPRIRLTKSDPQLSGSSPVETVGLTTESSNSQNTCAFQTYSLGYKTSSISHNFELKISSSSVVSGGGASVTAGNGIDVSGGAVSVDLASNSLLKLVTTGTDAEKGLSLDHEKRKLTGIIPETSSGSFSISTTTLDATLRTKPVIQFTDESNNIVFADAQITSDTIFVQLGATPTTEVYYYTVIV